MTVVEVTAATNTGLVRTRNEDAYGFTGIGAVQARSAEDARSAAVLPLLAVVADGLGGRPDGDIASRLVVEAMLHSQLVSLGSQLVNEETLAGAVIESHRTLIDRQQRNGGAAAGSTLATVVVLDDQVVVANVGDSRVFVVEPDGPMTQLSIDDVPSGASPGAPNAGLTQCLGPASARTTIEPHLRTVPVFGAMRLLLCTDGLSSHVPTVDIADRLRAGDAQAACKALINLALDAGGSDNITVIVIDIRLASGHGDR